MKKVLIPIDFSDNAFNALKYACQLFKYEHSEFFILHAFADEVYSRHSNENKNSIGDIKEIVYQNSEKKLKKIWDEIMEYSPNPKHKYKTLSAFGTLTDEANDLVNQENIDIVVMGTKGKTNDPKITFGSNTVQLLKYVLCPVLAIPENFLYHQPKKILFPTDYLVPYKRRELKLLNEMSGSFISTIHMLYINPKATLSLWQEDNKQFLLNGLTKPDLVFDTILAEDKSVAINQLISKSEIDLLVMINTRHSYMEKVLFHSSIDEITLTIKVPFLVMQNRFR
ncbi:universal stress protein [Maribacter arcticus]|uniref:Nucleotide-binding universal stress protein, UspA family n=1 Tax=Maribacter arcticus TaxID=561365 RepID=A0A1T5CGX6_9FLAO|nr:universal stress protein [Maribacter arcticus]SKB58707.1 Nucleotide-binding universal stress protein, UspA family [Maribacter arcticus]